VGGGGGCGGCPLCRLLEDDGLLLLLSRLPIPTALYREHGPSLALLRLYKCEFRLAVRRRDLFDALSLALAADDNGGIRELLDTEVPGVRRHAPVSLLQWEALVEAYEGRLCHATGDETSPGASRVSGASFIPSGPLAPPIGGPIGSVTRGSLLALGLRSLSPKDFISFVDKSPHGAGGVEWMGALTPRILREAISGAERRVDHDIATIKALSETRAALTTHRGEEDALSPEGSRLCLAEVPGILPQADRGRLLSCPRGIGDGIGPWGVVCSLARDCPVCGVPLSPHEDTVVFPCGHSFHAACVMEEACPQCFTENCTTMG